MGQGATPPQVIQQGTLCSAGLTSDQVCPPGCCGFLLRLSAFSKQVHELRAGGRGRPGVKIGADLQEVQAWTSSPLQRAGLI